MIAALLSVSPAAALPRGMQVDTYKQNLAYPVDMAWVQGSSKIFFTEKNTGKVRVITHRRLRSRACVDLDVNATGERGALGIVLHPNFEQNHFLYVYFTNDSPLEHRVVRFRVENNRCRDRRRIVTGISADSGGYHNGGQLEFMGGKLFVSTGEQHDPSLAQDTNNRLGKILRYNPDGSVPNGNPFSLPANSNPVWSYGHRNPFGLAHKPGTNQLYSSENGESCDDELNRIVRGRNYGWGPSYNCGSAGVGPNPKRPLYRWNPVVAPTDAWWYRGRLDRLSNRLYVGDYLRGQIHRFRVNKSGTNVRGHSVIFNGDAAVIDVSEGPGRWLYFLTPNAIRRIVRS